MSGGANWAMRRILNKFWGDFEKRVTPVKVGVRLPVVQIGSPTAVATH